MNEPAIDLSTVSVVVFDTDGVVTDTARGHAAAWKHVFDAFLRGRSAPFDIRDDYLRHVGGRTRLDGVRAFLASRGLQLPEGAPDDEPGAPTVHGLGRAKDRLFVDQVDEYGVAAFPSTVALLHELRHRGARTAAVSAGMHGRKLITSAAVTHLFDVLVDGDDAALLNLPGLPDPALFLEAARRLAVPPPRTAVVAAALPGVEAARKAGFGLVVAVGRPELGDERADERGEELREHGADVVVADLGELTVRGRVLPWGT
ncbi:HAD family hydrolase [Nonomuraea rhodomycinica]|uniref:HAD hydrolase-like protein n=1 Tax=Nonomuraea rhodomycinica TaxID=1712872 RepID=A0A7Y6IXE3_9ACTN|nr:HAD family hydrolase [Nonomuraea rhodomycinica]NUW45608.1 HAD hydrolase-like protein [Nonomuraea rhodomycinica]